jgi:hypothetical protein
MLVTKQYEKEILIVTQYWKKVTAGRNLHNTRTLQGLWSDPYDLAYGRVL